MKTVYRKDDLLSAKQELQKRLRSLQNNRRSTLKKAMTTTVNDNELEELTLQLEKIDWKLKALF